VDLKDDFGKTALMLASVQKHLSAVRVLLEAGADVELADNVGVTALMFAVGIGLEGTVRVLLEAGAGI